MTGSARDSDGVATISEHLRELRVRVIVIVLFYALFAGIAYLFHKPVENAFLQPLGNDVYYSSITGGFEFMFNVVLLIGAILVLPVVLYNLLRFSMPALPKHIQFHPFKLVFFSYLFVLISVAFTYYFALPTVLGFLFTFSTNDIKPLISTSEYLSFIKWYFLSFGIVFQIPVVLLTVDSLFPLPMKTLRKMRRWVIVASLLFAATLVPTPQIWKQAISASPIIILYESSLFIIWFRSRKPKKELAKWTAEQNAKADQHFKAGEFEEAKTLYLEIITKNIDPAKEQNRLGVIYMKEKDFFKAREILEKAIKSDPTLASAYANLGITNIEIGEPQTARDNIKKALELKPDSEKYKGLLELIDKK